MDVWYQLGALLDNPLISKFKRDILGRVGELEVLELSPNSDVMWCGIR